MMRPEASIKNIARMRAYKMSDQASVTKNSRGPVQFDTRPGIIHGSQRTIGWIHKDITAPEKSEVPKIEAAAKKFRANTKCWVKTSFDLENEVRDTEADRNQPKLPVISAPSVQDQKGIEIENFQYGLGGVLEFPPNESIPPSRRADFLKKQREDDNDQCWYLTDCLIYDVHFTEPKLNTPPNKRFLIDPFSVFIPLKLEAELDRLVEIAVFASHRLPEFKLNPAAHIDVID
ncbi:hypothetical protein DL93DRAFT_578297 [Clavulina sp. PMI_390]|nr:hypothetical protein DL93DRAFT_578297 [Clavulina sp. PMI_390]